jgi:hypothetical protein
MINKEIGLNEEGYSEADPEIAEITESLIVD